MWIVYHGSYGAVEVPAIRKVVSDEPVEVPDHIGEALVSQGDFSEVKHAPEPDPEPEEFESEAEALTDEDGEE